MRLAVLPRLSRSTAIALLGVSLSLASPPPARAQTGGLSCFKCQSVSATEGFACRNLEQIHEGEQCPFGNINCRTPRTTQLGVEAIPTGSDTFQARLVVEVVAPFNSEHTNPNTILNIYWAQGSDPDTATTVCQWGSGDRVFTFWRAQGLTCDGAPYDLGTYSLRAVSCENTGCERSKDEIGMEFMVTKADLGCPDPPKQNCGAGDAASCRVCTPAGVGPGQGLPGFGAPGDILTGPNATLRYAAGGAGHPDYPGTPAWNVALGRYWSHDYAERIVAVGSPSPEDHVWMITRYGTFREWSDPDPGTGVYTTVSPSDEYRTLTWTGSGWTLAELDGTVHAFDGAGLWLSTTDRNGNATIGHYTAGQLTSVDLPDQRHEEFTYYPAGDPQEGKLATLTEYGTDGTTHLPSWRYTWQGDDLSEIERPDGTVFLFEYDPTTGYLAKVTLQGDDGASTRVVRAWSYDAEGKVSDVWKGSDTPAAGTEHWHLSYDSASQTTVTDPLGQDIVYTYERDPASPNVRVTQIDGDCPVCGLGPNATLSYDDTDNPLLPTAIVDGRGTTTSFTSDGSGQTVTRTEADGDPLQRMTTWTYDTSYPALVTSVMQPSVAGGGAMRATDWMLDGSGNATKRTVSGVEAGSAFTYETNTTYNGAGQPLTIDPDGHGTDDLTVFTYDAARGDLFPMTREDPIVGVTTFGYDDFNRRTSVTDPNGVTTTTAYDDLDRVTEIRQEGASPPTDDLATRYSYTVFGDLFRTTLPAGNVIEYGYDPAGRLTSVERKPDGATHGERVVYTLDEAGDRSLEELQRWETGMSGSGWVTYASTAYEYTNRCQVDRIIQAPETSEASTTAFEYDCNGNLAAQWDAKHDRAVDPPTTSYEYDPLDRLTSVSQPWEGAGGGDAVTSYAYDVQDHLVSVTDAELNVTTYAYSDRDLLTSERSSFLVPSGGTCLPAPACDPTPGCGCTTHGYDEHGELITTTDARGITVAREVDAFDRVTLVNYPDDALDTDFAYDTAPASCSGASFPVGRLSAITRDGEAVEYCYDRFGRTAKDGELTYLYDGNGNRTGIGYPGNVSATYGFDFADREVSLSVTSLGGTEMVVSNASYLPSGPLSSLVLGSTVTETRGFDGRYAPTAIALSGPVEKTFSYTTDPAGNVLEILEQGACTPGPVVLENQTVTTPETFTSCTTIEAGNAFTVEGPDGDVTFQAQGTVILKDGFSVGSGGRFTAGSGEIPPLSVRTYAYQAPQYFLTAADGPWGTLDWTWDKIGNRLTESRDQGATQDGYAYATNGGGGNTPILDLANLAVGGTRAYTWDAAGNLDSVAPGGNLVDFQFDDASRLSTADRTTSGGGAAAFLYDGRGFLRSAAETAGGTASVSPLYDSSGLVHALRRQPTPTDPIDTIYFFYLAGRPVAQLESDGSGAETWIYLTTDHLGTPLVATDDAGVVAWEGELEPFGADHQANTMAGALDNGVYLRLPGQWDDGTWSDATWSDATSGAGIYYNVWRFLEPQTGRYTRPDPARILGISDYVYALVDPISIIDPSGLLPAGTTADDTCLICTVYAEARGQSPACQQAVASVIINRFLNCGGSTLCGIVSKPGQFDGYGNTNYKNCDSCAATKSVPDLDDLLTNIEGFGVEPDADFFVNNNPASIRNLLRGGLRVDPVPFGGCSTFAFYKTRSGVSGGYCP